MGITGLRCCGPQDAFGATTDRTGSFSFSVPLVDRYAITARDTTYAAFGVVRVAKIPIIVESDTTETPGATRRAVIALDPAIDAARIACKRNTMGPGPSVLLIRLLPTRLDTAQKPVPTQWRVVAAAAEEEITFHTLADHIAICGIPAGAVTVHASDAKGGTGRAFFRSSGKAVIDTVTIEVDRKGASRPD
jgi:hypothetical protein